MTGPRLAAEQNALRRERAAVFVRRAILLEDVANRVRDILSEGLSDDGAVTLEGALIIAYREMRPAIDEILDGRC